MLRAAGHTVDDRDILSQTWQSDGLHSYFGQMPVCDWFNMTAPAIKTGTLLIHSMSGQEAIEAMMDDPLLIRRPLMEIEGQKICGFRFEELDSMIGLSPVQGREEEMQALRSENITTCPYTQTETNCDKQAAG